MVREVVSLAVGGCGLGLSLQQWQMHALELGLSADGCISAAKAPRSRAEDPLSVESLLPAAAEDVESRVRFFSEDSRGRFTPRALLVDCDSERVDAARSGAMRDLFASDSFLAGDDGSAVTFARGKLRLSSRAADDDLLEAALERIRRMADACDSVQGFILTHALAGGSGGGLAAARMERLSIEFDKKTKLTFSVVPAPSAASCVVEPLNAVLATHALLEHSDISVALDNDALESLCRRKLNIERPTFANLNALTAHALSGVTYAMRFDGYLHTSLQELVTNHVPYPRIHWTMLSFAPFISSETCVYEPPSTLEIGLAPFEVENLLVSCSSWGKFMSCSMAFRGDVVPKDVGPVVCQLKYKRSIQFVDWCPTGFKCGITYSPPTVIPGGDLALTQRQVCVLQNATGVSEVFTRVTQKYDRLWAKRAFVHWFTSDGLEEGAFTEAREDLAALEQDYIEVATEAEEEAGEEEGDEY